MSPEYVAEWVRKAEADRAAAKRALQDALRRKDQAEIACFHAQQCAEKFLKALLAKANRTIPRIHDLRRLAKRIRNPRFPKARLRDDFEMLNQFSVEIRYPGTSATTADAREAVRAMDNVARAARALLRLTPR